MQACQQTLKEAIVSHVGGMEGLAFTDSSYDVELLGAIHTLLDVNTANFRVDDHMEWWCHALERPGGHRGLEFSEMDEARIGAACTAVRNHPHSHDARVDRLFSAVLVARGRRV